MERLCIGIDAGGDTVAICVIDGEGAILGEVVCDSAPHVVAEQLIKLGATLESRLGIEAGGCGTQLTRKLRQAGYAVRVLDTRYVSGFLKLTQNKTDRNDAYGIAEIVRLGAGAVPDVLVKAEAIQMLRSELVLRHRLMAQRIALENALRGTFRLNGGKIARIYSGTHLERVVSEELDRLRAEGIDLRELINPVLGLLIDLRRALEQSNRRLDHRARNLDACKRFMSIPGVGTICALSFYTAVENPHRFDRSADIGPYLGLVPRVSQSGIAFRWGRISRMGNTMTRTHLVSAAMSMLLQANKDSDLRRWAVRVSERAGRGKARVALARKLATVMIAMWKSGEQFRADSAKSRINEDHHERQLTTQ
jgi:transposase